CCELGRGLRRSAQPILQTEAEQSPCLVSRVQHHGVASRNCSIGAAFRPKMNQRRPKQLQLVMSKTATIVALLFAALVVVTIASVKARAEAGSGTPLLESR